MKESGKNKIVYATGSRADYGIVRKYLKYLKNDDNIDISLLVTGTHLSYEHGYSIAEIKKDGYKIAKEISLDLHQLGKENITAALATVVKESGNFFAKNEFELLILLGDRYEILGVAIAAAINGIPILHLHGGEQTLGNYDEFIRHSITKMSAFHFTSTEEYRRRVIQMGENPNNVFNVGALGAENCLSYDFSEVIDQVRALHDEKYFVVVFHPETASGKDPIKQVDELFKALLQLPQEYKLVVIGTNADTGADKLQERILAFQEKSQCVYFQNLNSSSYLDLIAHAQGLIGNSSSGIIEAPTLGTYTVNIGDRQLGRIRASSVFDVPCQCEDILNAVLILCNKPKGETIKNPYYQKNVSLKCYKKTKEILRLLPLAPKIFYDYK